MRMLCDKLDLLKRLESTCVDMKGNIRMVADAPGEVVDIVEGLHCDTLSSYEAILGNLDRSLVEVSANV